MVFDVDVESNVGIQVSSLTIFIERQDIISRQTIIVVVFNIGDAPNSKLCRYN